MSANNPTNAHRDPFWLDRTTIFCLFVIVLVTLLAYSNVLTAGFIWDDDDYVTANQLLRTTAGFKRIWLEPGATPQYYPMVFSLFWVQFHLWGLNPLGYHIVNIVLHIANAILLWRCCVKLEISEAFWVACIFAVHPVHVESVAWITELKNVLSTTFYFLAFLFYCRVSDPKAETDLLTAQKWTSYLLSFCMFLCALFSKTVTGSLPAALLLVYWWKRGYFPWRDSLRLLPFFAVALFLGRQTVYLEVNKVMATGPEWGFTLVERILIAGRSVWFYAAKLFWPYPLVFTYPRWHIDSGAWPQYLYPVGLLLLAGILWFTRNRIGRGPLAAFLFFIGTLFPALGFINIYPMLFSFVADHFQYLASIGMIIFFCTAINRLLKREDNLLHRWKLICFTTIILILAGLTWQQGKIYKNRMSLYNDIINKNPTSWMAFKNRGAVYYGQKEFDLAMADYQQALSLKPTEAGTLNNRAMVFAIRKEHDKALQDYNKALQLEPGRHEFYANRGKLYLDMNLHDLALADYDKALQLAPSYVVGHLLRAIIFGLREEYDKALSDLNEVVRLEPSNPDGYANRGLVFFRQGLMDKAISDFSQALLLNPLSETTYFNRGLAFLAKGNRHQAREDLERSLKLGYPVSQEQIEQILALGT